MTASRPSPTSKARGWRRWRRWRGATRIGPCGRRHHHQRAAAARAAARRRSRRRQFLRQGRRGGRPRRAGRVPCRQWLCRAPARCASRAISRCAAASSICGRRAAKQPLRLDFFGATLDAIRRFDAETQLSNDSVDEIELLPASEAPLDRGRRSAASAPAMSRLRAGAATIRFMKASAPAARRRAWSIGCRCSMTSSTRCSIICRAALVLLGHQVEEAKAARLELIADYYETREQFRAPRPTTRTRSRRRPTSR